MTGKKQTPMADRDDRVNKLLSAVQSLLDRQENYQSLQEDVASLKQDNVRYIIPAIQKINDEVYLKKSDFLAFHKDEFEPVDQRTRNSPIIQNIVFGMVGLILVAVVGALIALVINKGGL